MAERGSGTGERGGASTGDQGARTRETVRGDWETLTTRAGEDEGWD